MSLAVTILSKTINLFIVGPTKKIEIRGESLTVTVNNPLCFFVYFVHVSLVNIYYHHFVQAINLFIIGPSKRPIYKESHLSIDENKTQNSKNYEGIWYLLWFFS